MPKVRFWAFSTTATTFNTMNLYWFRTDLRLTDNTALYHATQDDVSIALFIITPQQWLQHHDAPCKIDFYLRQLKTLSHHLQQLNIPLLIRYCDFWHEIPALLLDICQSFNINKVYCNQEYGVHEQQRDSATLHLLQQHSIDFLSYQDKLIFTPGTIKNKTAEYYKVFSAFKQICYENIYAQEIYFKTNPPPKKQTLTHINSDPIPDAVIGFENTSPNIQQQWQVGEKNAWLKLDQFIDEHINQYHLGRDYPARGATSQLSPYLNAGVLSIRQCLQAARINTEGTLPSNNNGVNTWFDELLWREFYTHILYGFPHISRHQPFKIAFKHIAWRTAPDDLYAWQHGLTGFPIIDAAMRQLLTTGWMHNRLRMIVAMFLCKNLLIDWRHGEKWFMQHLIDGDLAANNGGWQWCASTGTDSVPYFRIFNPITQSKKFDPEGQFIRSWLPALAHLDHKAIHEPYKYLKHGDKLDYPQPMIDLKLSRNRAIAAFQKIKA